MHAVSLTAQSAPWPSAWPPLLRRLALAWAAFFMLTTLYCFGYARVVGGAYMDTLAAALGCAARDWLLWALLSPLLLRLGARLASERARPALALLACTLAVGAYRVLLEATLGAAALLETAYVYAPRYAFVATGFALAGLVAALRAGPRHRAGSAPVAQAPPPPAAPDTLLASTGTARALVRIDEVLCVTASGNYLELHTARRRYLLRGTMKAIEAQLAGHDFVRVHRSSLVRRTAIATVSRRRRELRLVDGTMLRLGDRYLGNLPHLSGRPSLDPDD